MGVKAIFPVRRTPGCPGDYRHENVKDRARRIGPKDDDGPAKRGAIEKSVVQSTLSFSVSISHAFDVKLFFS